MSGHQHCINCLKESAGLYNYPCVECGWSPEQHTSSGLYLSPGTILHGQYQIARMLGHGGFGITYLAWDNLLEIKLAIKEYMPRDFATRNTTNSEISTFAGDAKESFAYGLERFLDEARTLAKFQQHSGIVSVLNVFYGNGTGYMVMEYVDGLTLKEYLLDKGKLSWEQTLHLFMPVMDALRAVHKAGMLHRDISPDNIYLCQDNRIKLLDFGSARFALGGHSRSLSVVVKPGYAPEEQYRTKGKQGSWTDVYSVAASMYRCVTGLVPPEALDRLDVDELIKPSLLGVKISAVAEKALMSALAIKAENRTQTIEALQKHLTSSANLINESIVIKSQSTTKESIDKEPLTIIPDDDQFNRSHNFGGQYKTRIKKTERSGSTNWWILFILLLVYIWFVNSASESTSSKNIPTITSSNQQQSVESPNQSIKEQVELAKKYYKSKDYSQALTWFQKAATQGDSYAQFRLGGMYHYGEGVEQNLKNCAFWYQKAADHGDSNAQNNLGYMFLNGIGVEQSYMKALALYQKSADQGNAYAQNNLGEAYVSGKGIIQDSSKAVEWFSKAAAQDLSGGQLNLGWYYMNGFGNLSESEIDYTKSIYWNQKAADNGNSEGFNNLGWLYQNGFGVGKDLIKSAELYQSAISLGIKNGVDKERIDEAKSRLSKVNSLIKANAAQEQQDETIDAEAQIKLANEFYSKKNYKEAIVWYRKAADQGNIAGQYNLGILYEKGLGVKTDLDQAISWYQIAANQNDKDAVTHLTNAQIKLAGQLYQAKNYKEAVSLYRTLAEQGNSVGQYNLGILYEKGLGVSTDVEQAKVWFQKAAYQGDADAVKKINGNIDAQEPQSYIGQTNYSFGISDKLNVYKLGDKLPDGSVIFYIDVAGLSGLAAMPRDYFTQGVTWENAKELIANKGDGWRLPNLQELDLLYKNKDLIGGFSPSNYWSSTESNNEVAAWAQFFPTGHGYNADKTFTYRARAVRNF